MKCNNINIVLVHPSEHGEVRSLFNVHQGEGVGRKPPLGIMILATFLMKNGFEKVRCIDAQFDDLSPQRTAERLAELEPDIVGITAWTDWWYAAWKTVQLVRGKLPHCTIILGGPHCTVFPKEALEVSEADFLVVGDGEETLLGLVKAISENREIGDLPGLWHKDGGEIREPTDSYAVVKDLTSIPTPNRHLLPYKQYASVLSPQKYETTMVTSRGCPYRCSFCKIDVQKVYANSAEKVIEEFRECAELGISDIQIYDDTFTWSRQRVIDICQGLIDNKINVRWAVRDRVNKVDSELLTLMRKAGCYRIHYGVESGSNRILNEAGKMINVEQAVHAISEAKRLNFETVGFYMFGFFDETREEAQQTIDLALRLNTDYALFSVLIPYPGTLIYKQGLESGILPYDFWLKFTKNPVPDFELPALIEHHMDRETLIRLRNKAYRRYYFRPSRLIREILRLRSHHELMRKVKMGLRLALTENAGADQRKS